jgi:guanine deaminase
MPHQPDPAHIRRAVKLATQNVLAGTGGPFAAVIVRDGEVIAEAANSVTTTNDPTAHGEINAIRKACVALGSFYWARLGAIYYGSSQQDAAKGGFDDAFLYEEFRKNSPERSIPSVQLLQDEAWVAFATWQAVPAKVDY